MVFEPRRVVSLGLVHGAWTAKVYAIYAARWQRADLPDVICIAQAVRAAMPTLDSPLDHAVGFAILHMAEDGIYLLLTRFNNANNLRHCVFDVSLDGGGIHLERLADPHLISCVWELRLMMAEADHWITAVLGPGLGLTAKAAQDYLDLRYRGQA